MASQLEAAGWVVGSRRHRADGGDLLAVNSDGRRWLVECKATKGMWSHFGPADRDALEQYADRRGLIPVLAWRLPGNKVRWLFAESWPRRERDEP